jgi:ectoine hydroxylase-related dioxygenase (phytanoyl-CoA dioxygenase family)
VRAGLPEKGFATIPGPFRGSDLETAIAAYDRAVATAWPEDRKEGSTSIRVNALLDRAPELAAILTRQPLLDAAAALIGGPFKLSAFHSRSIRPGAAAQALHQDVAPGEDGWPLLGFILMIDPFEVENGATRFLPGSADLRELPEESPPSGLEYACGPAGSLLLFDGSVWHGHSANITARWRRSVQGALIPKGATAAVDHRSYLQPEIWSALPPDARLLME